MSEGYRQVLTDALWGLEVAGSTLAEDVITKLHEEGYEIVKASDLTILYHLYRVVADIGNIQHDTLVQAELEAKAN